MPKETRLHGVLIAMLKRLHFLLALLSACSAPGPGTINRDAASDFTASPADVVGAFDRGKTGGDLGGVTPPDIAPHDAALVDIVVGCQPPCRGDQRCKGDRCEDLPSQCPCPTGSYCDLAINRCLAGCAADQNCDIAYYCDTGKRTCRLGCRTNGCGSNEHCDMGSRVCQCNTGHHRCAGRCVPENVGSCGPSCAVCRTDPLGQASCGPQGCRLTCNNGHQECGGQCTPCDLTNANGFTCSGASCLPQCVSEHHLCSGRCVREDWSSCGPSCRRCPSGVGAACKDDLCYSTVEFSSVTTTTSCGALCQARGLKCAKACNISQSITAGVLSQKSGSNWTHTWVECQQQAAPGTTDTRWRCCCTE